MSHWNKEPPPMVQWPSKQCLCTNPKLILFLLFPEPRWQTGRLLKVIRPVPPGPLEPRWWPGHIPKCSCCSGPQRRQAHWGATSPSPWRWGDRLATAQTHTFMVSDSASLRSPPCLTAIARKLWSPSLPPRTHSLSLFVVFFKASASTRRPTVHPSLPWQCYPCKACWEQWWDVRLDLQVWAGPKRGCNAKGLPTLSMAHAPLWSYLRVWKLHSQKQSPLRSSHYWLLKKTGLTGSVQYPCWSMLSCLIRPMMFDRQLHTFKCIYHWQAAFILVIILIFKVLLFPIVYKCPNLRNEW